MRGAEVGEVRGGEVGQRWVRGAEVGEVRGGEVGQRWERGGKRWVRGGRICSIPTLHLRRKGGVCFHLWRTTGGASWSYGR